ncbi:MAG: hypothetical protein IKQ39_02365 [Oscillospiraceae bacterium]|nr:hypothetical protein [Oscillospiraceae bacterium]
MSTVQERPRSIRIADADGTAFFPSGLEYNTPVRGMWNIVHTGMLVPGAHQIFACAQGCLRGVILTAAEMNALDRLSWISVSEQDMYDGSLEYDIIGGCAEILHKLPEQPKIVLLFLSCIHLFAGVDFDMILRTLHEQFPQVKFVDCYMTPTMRQTVPPAFQMAAQLYAALEARPNNPKAVSIIGNDRPTDEQSELVRLIRENGFVLHDLTLCKTYDAYQRMAESALSITYTPIGRYAGEALEQRLGIPQLYLPNSFDYAQIRENYRQLCNLLGMACPDFKAEMQAADAALDAAQREIGSTAVAIDFTAVTRPFELALLLCEHGFSVKYVIADAAGEERAALDRLRTLCPDLEILSAVNVNMLHLHDEPHEPVLAVGQKAAYYFATDHFVNIVVNGGYYGFAGIQALAKLMTEAFREPKDSRTVLRHKGLGCASCLL